MNPPEINLPQAAGPADLALVTGATGLLGSHLVERLLDRGYHVRALLRPGSVGETLEAQGVEIVRGDLTDPKSCATAVRDADLVFHCAAKVGDWGSWSEFQTGCIDATRILAQAAADTRVSRFVHISSTSAYGHPRDRPEPVTESEPLGQNVWWLDHYTRSKVECERELWALAEAGRLPLTVIRPSWLFGERDRTTVPRLLREFRRGRVLIVGRGDNPLSAVHAGVVADAALLAASHKESVNQAYNITSHSPITQHEFLDLFADAIGVPRVTRHVPFRLAFAGGFAMELHGRLLKQARPPRVTRYGVWLLGRYLSYSTDKARTQLGWQPAIGYRESIERTIEWFRQAERAESSQSRQRSATGIG